MTIFHSEGCNCEACATEIRESTSDTGTPTAPGQSGATKQVYSTAEVINALRTSDGAYGSISWEGSTLTYSIGTGQLSAGHSEYDTEHAGYVAMSAAMEAAAVEAFELWDDLIAIDLVALENDPFADISFNYSSNTGGGTYAQYSYTWGRASDRSDYRLVDSDVWLADHWWTHNQDGDLYQGGYGIMTYIHEIGHTLGLSHPGAYNGSGSFGADATHFQDTRGYTVMSYFNADQNGSGTDHYGTMGRSYGATPLLHDILAVQAIYGADMTTRTESTVYGFGSTAGRAAFDFTINLNPVVAIWDAGGRDLIDVSGWSTDQVLDLGEGALSSVGAMTHNLAIAYGTIIENGTTGAGNDILLGNAVGNRLDGGAGDDILEGGDGRDLLRGGAGADQLDGGDGEDWACYIKADSGVTVDLSLRLGTRGDAAGDTFVRIENLYGSGHDDVLIGANGALNRLMGGAGNDVLDGLGARDFLFGNDGDDSLFGGEGGDFLMGGAGADLLDGGESLYDWARYDQATSGIAVDLGTGTGSAGEALGDVLIDIERVRGSAHDDVIIGDAERNVLVGREGDDRIEGHGGRDVLHGNAGDDELIGGETRDVLVGGVGADVLNGAGGNDWAHYHRSESAVSVSLQDGTASGGEAEGDVLIDIERLWGSDFDDILTGDHGRNVLIGGLGADTITGHQDNDTLIGRAGRDTFQFAEGDGRDHIRDFELGIDLIRFTDTVATFDDLVVTSTKTGAMITYGSGDSILLRSVDVADLDSDQFIFG